MLPVSLISPIYMGLVGLMTLWLSYDVSRNRIAHKVSTGDGGVPSLFKAIRVHANLIENAPLALILLLAVELQGAPGWSVHALGLAFIIGRVVHAYGLGGGTLLPRARTIGALITLIYLLIVSVMAIALTLF